MLSFYVKSQNLITRAKNLLNREEGQGMVEYAMIVGLVSVGVLALLTTMGGQVSSIFGRITTALGSIGN